MSQKKYLIKKSDTATLSNILNEMFYEEKMTLQEMRFFLVYLSKINPKEPDKAEVSFSLEEYAEILGVELNEKAIDASTRKVLRHVVCVRPTVLDDDVLDERIYCQLFSKARLTRRKKDNKYYLSFTCHDDVKDKIFNLTSEYTRMEIWNAVNLSNLQDIRMYMLLRQYKTIGERTIHLKELKKMLGIDVTAYPEYKIFARAVLKKCQSALKLHTDICFDFNAVGRPAKAVHFNIYTNKDYKLPKFLAAEEEKIIDALPEQESLFGDDMPEEVPQEDPLRLSMDALPPELTRGQVEALRELALEHIPYDHVHTIEDKELWLYHFLKKKTSLMKSYPDIKNPFGWLKRAVAEDWQ